MDWLLPWLPGFAAAYAIQTVAVLSPGPAVALILAVAADRGRGAALATAGGVAVGTAGLAVSANLGLAVLLMQVAWAVTAIKLAGAAYLAWLSLKAFRRALDPPPLAVGAVPRMSTLRSALLGLLLQITNPKAMVFWVAIASVGATRHAPVPVWVAFTAGAFAISFAGHGAYALLLSSAPVRRAYQRARRWVEAGIGAVLGVMALRLVLERR